MTSYNSVREKKLGSEAAFDRDVGRKYRSPPSREKSGPSQKVYPMWHDFKEPIVELFSMSREALHIHFGLALFLLGTVQFRNASRRFFFAWLFVLIAQSINEVLDFHDWYLWTHSWNWYKSLQDYVNTMLWPSVLFIISTRWAPKSK